MSRLTRDGTAEPVSLDQILRHVRGQGNINFPCSADHKQDWQPYPVDPYSAICDDHTYIHTYNSQLVNEPSNNSVTFLVDCRATEQCAMSRSWDPAICVVTITYSTSRSKSPNLVDTS